MELSNAIQDRSHSLLRLLAAGEPGAYRRRNQRKLRAAAETCAKRNLILIVGK